MFFTRMFKKEILIKPKALIILCLFLLNTEAYADKDSAFHWKGYYNTDIWYGLQGGLEDKGRYLGRGDLNLNIDFEKILNTKALNAFIEIQTLNGQRPNLLVNSIEGVNSIQGFDNIEYDRVSAMTYLYQFWLQKSSDQGSLLLGLYDLNSEFYYTDSSQVFILPTFGIGTDLGQTGQNGPAIFPNPGSALRIKYTPDTSRYFQAAIFDAAAANPLNRAYPHPPFASGQGLLGIAEAGIFVGENKAKFGLGSWIYTKKMAQQLPEDLEIEDPLARNKGIYMLIDTPLYKTLHGVLRYGSASSTTNIFNKSLAFGLIMNAPFSKRPNDILAYGIAPAWTSQNSRWANPGLPRVEIQHELTYAAVITPWLSLQPDLIYIRFKGIHPESSYQNAFLLGLRLTLGFDQE